MRPKDFPLSWPAGRERTPVSERTVARFRLDFKRAYDDLCDAAERLHDADEEFVLSTCVPLTARGQPIAAAANRPHLGDPGVAVYVRCGGKVYAFTCDTYREVRHNMRAVWTEIQDLLATMSHQKHGVGRVAVTLDKHLVEFAAPQSRPAVPQLAASAG